MIILPWPPSKLSPNSRTHWATKAKVAKACREAAGWAAKASRIKVKGNGKVDLHITFNPPDKRKRDLDNCLSSCKSMLDGIADGLGVNDHRFNLHLVMGEVVKGGQVAVTINLPGNATTNQ